MVLRSSWARAAQAITGNLLATNLCIQSIPTRVCGVWKNCAMAWQLNGANAGFSQNVTELAI